MTGWIRIGVALAVASTMIFVGAPGSAAPSQDDYQDVVERLEEAREMVERLEDREDGLRGDISVTDARRRAVEIELEELNAVVERAQGELAASEAALGEVQRKLDQKTADLDAALKELEARHDLIAGRAASVYMNGPVSFLDIVLRAGDLRELVARVRFTLRIFQHDEVRLDSIRELKQRIANEREDIKVLRDRAAEQVAVVRAEHARVAELQAAVASRRRQLGAELDRQYANLRGVQSQKDLYLRQQEELEAESRRIASLLRGRTSGAATVSRGGMAWPTAGPVTSGYGWRTHPIFGTRRFHSGIDIGAPSGQSVVASAPGTVVHAGSKGGYGNAVIVDHGGGIATLYGHLSSVGVGVGTQLSGRGFLGRVGCTGYCTGPHLHFEVRVNGEPDNPMSWLG